MTAIIDYDAGNTASVCNAFRHLGTEVVLTDDKEQIRNADHVVLPGVGAFGDAMGKLTERGLVAIIREVHAKGTPLLGICVGMQLLYEASTESPGVAGLKLLQGTFQRFPESKENKVPQIGWNALEFPRTSKLLKDVPKGAHVYFVHSYYLPVEESASEICAVSQYGVPFVAAMEQNNLFACQFHPEKSADIGQTILCNFLKS